MRRLLCFVLSVAIMLPTASFGASKKELNINEDVLDFAASYIEAVNEDPSLYGMAGVDTKNLFIGYEMPVYSGKEGNISKDDSQSIYPILEGKKVVSILTVNRAEDGSTTYYFGSDYSKNVNKFLSKNKTKSLAVYLEDDKIFLISSKAKEEVFEFKFDKNEVSSNKRGASIETPGENLQIADVEYSEVKSATPIEVLANADYSVMATAPTSKTCNVAFVQQTHGGTCWACTVSSIGKYRTTINKTQEYICDKLGKDYELGGNVYDMKNAFSTIYGLSSYVAMTAPSDQMIIDKIVANKPIAAGFTNSKAGHAVAVCGYKGSSSGLGIVMMDPNRSSYRVAFKSGSKYSINTSAGTMYWNCSTILY